MMSTSNITAQAPRSVFFKPLSADFRSLFAALGRGVGHTATGKWEELGNDAVATLSALGVETDPGELAWLLIRRALTRAMFELVGESASPHLVDGKKISGDFEKALDTMPSAAEIQIDRRFFDRPADLPLLVDTAAILRQWLTLAGVGSHAAAAIAERLPAYFVFALNQEWRRNASQYAPLLEAVETPFAKAGERELAWNAYAALLQRRTEEGIFDEPFSLKQLYVPLRAYYADEPATRGPFGDVREKRRRVVVDLEQELRDWIAQPDPDDAIRVISGGPGSGKSSFARIFASRSGVRTLFAPLHLIDTDRDLTDAVSQFVHDEGVLTWNPLSPESPEPNLLIIFDGLDELASQGKAAAETARAFIREVEKTVEKRNANSVRLRVLISGRELVVQENESEFRRARQILNLLPYHANDQDLEDPSKLLDADQRQEWWKRYGAATGRNHAGLPQALSREDLEEITAQPLLNYLVALSYTRGKVDFAKAVNLNEIYADLLAAVYSRAYEKKRTYAPIRHMRFEEFVLVLEEIGLAAWHGDGRTTTVREIEEHCRKSGIDRLLEAFKEGAQQGITRLLAAFFFRQYGRRASGDPTFVFTHKSFGEYLAARRVARAMAKISRERQTSEQYAGEGWTERAALGHWAEICGPSAMTRYMLAFLISEIALQDETVIAKIQDVFTRLFSYVLQQSLPMETLLLPSFGVAMRQARNAEEALLAALNSCARRTRQLSRINHPDPLTFGTWLRRIQGQLVGDPGALAVGCLSYLNLAGVHLIASDLMYADLSGSDLSNTAMTFSACGHARFDEATLHGTHLRRSYLASCSFHRARITETNFDGAFLRWATFDEAVVTESSFDGANLETARLMRINADAPSRVSLGLKEAARMID